MHPYNFHSLLNHTILRHVSSKVNKNHYSRSFFIKNSNFSDANNNKFVLDRINQTEKYLGSICVQVGKVCRKEARLRDCNDELVQNMFEFADRERINTTLRQSLQQYAAYLSSVEDYRNALVSLHFRVVQKTKV